MKRLQEIERCCRENECELMRQLDKFTIAVSQAALEPTRRRDEELDLEQELHRHEAQ
jgi:hypothetical protein